MKIYTKTGDTGETGLFGGPRVWKDDPRIEAYGDVDELNSLLGVARAEGLPAEIDPIIRRVQDELFCVGAELATPNAAQHGHALIGEDQTLAMENAIDHFEARLKPLREFILPGGSKAAALLHLARTVCRRAERRVITFGRNPEAALRGTVVIYLNRLSDMLFVLARAANALLDVADVPWQKPESTSEK